MVARWSAPSFALSFPLVPLRGCFRAPSTLTQHSSRYTSTRFRVYGLRCSLHSPDVGSTQPNEGEGLNGEVRDALDDAIRDVMRSSSSLNDMREGEQRVFDGIVELGEDDLRQIGGALSEELSCAGDDIADRIDTLLQGELDVTLTKFERKRDELMQEALNQRDVIREEAERINALASSLDRSSASSKEGNVVRGKQGALFAISGLFGVAALMYGWRGFVDESNAALQSAALDAVAASAAAYFYDVGEKKAAKIDDLTGDRVEEE